MNKKILLLFSAFTVVFALLAILIDFFMLLLHGLSQAVFEGNSTGKTFVMLLWFFLLPLISFLFLKFNLTEKLKVYSKTFLRVFLFFAFLGYALGLIQFGLISMEFNSLGPFATIAENNERISWQASKLSHNHFPKASLYVLEKNLGANFGGNYDNGFPWYSFIPDAGLWAVFYLLIELIVFFSALLYINSKLKEISLFDFLVFLAGFLAVLISVLDGGIASGAAMMAVFFLALFFSRNYLSLKNHSIATLLPLFVISFIGFADVILPLEIGNNFYASSMILFFGLAYYFFIEKKLGKLSFSFLNAVLALILLASFVLSASQFLDFSFGREIQPNYFIYSFQEEKAEGGLFVYGLPEELEKEKVDFEAEQFGKIIYSDKSGWSYFVLIKPERNFRMSELELILKKKFSENSYLYVEQSTPVKEIEAYKILWFNNEFDSNKLIKDSFLGIKVLEKKDNFKENSTDLVVEEKVSYLWGMNSILSEIRANGFTGKVLVIKKS